MAIGCDFICIIGIIANGHSWPSVDCITELCGVGEMFLYECSYKLARADAAHLTMDPGVTSDGKATMMKRKGADTLYDGYRVEPVVRIGYRYMFCNGASCTRQR